MSTVSQCLRALACAASMTVACNASAQGKDELWDMTVKMDMAGMPSMPAQSHRICKPAGKNDENLIPQKENCKISDVKRSGNKLSFKMACDQDGSKFTGTGEMTSGPDSMNGIMKMKGTMDGESMDMSQSFSGKKVGSCNFEDQGKKIQAQMDSSKAEACGASMDELVTFLVAPGQYCEDQKPKFCAKVTQVAREMAEPAGYKTAYGRYGDLDAALKLCGQDPAKIQIAVCKRAADKKDWGFVAEKCEADARTIAAKQCDGRSYTVAMSSEYAPICQRYAKDMGRAYTAQARAGEKPGAVDQLKDGASKLKKFLKF